MKTNLAPVCGEEFEGSVVTRRDSIYPVLAHHQRNEPWACQQVIVFLQSWTADFISEFKLDIPSVALCVDKLPSKCLGHFRPGHNGFGLRGEIAINSAYLPPKRQPWDILGTLLHELLHAWQYQHGTPGGRFHHNLEFRQKALELGLVIDRRGVTGYAANSPFKDLLRGCGIDVPPGESAPRVERQPANSKLIKWSCSCSPRSTSGLLFPTSKPCASSAAPGFVARG